jgi:hypothetical protein
MKKTYNNGLIVGIVVMAVIYSIMLFIVITQLAK